MDSYTDRALCFCGCIVAVIALTILLHRTPAKPAFHFDVYAREGK